VIPLLVLGVNLALVGWRVTIAPPDWIDLVFAGAICAVLWLTLSRRGRILVLALFAGHKYREYVFDRQLFQAMRPIRGSVSTANEKRTARSIEQDRLRAIGALQALAPPNAQWDGVRDDFVRLLSDEIKAAEKGINPVEVDEFRSRSMQISARVLELRSAYGFRRRSDTGS
jgi:hypothetical protein